MIKATVKAGAEFQADQPVTVEKLNALGTPTVDISGTVESEDIATEAVTNAKLQQETETTDGAVNNAVVADDAAISLSKLEGVASENIVAGNSEGKAKAHELVGDVSLTRARKVPFDGGTVTVGMKIRIKGTDNVSHTGEVVKVDGSNAFYKPTSEAHGDIQDDSEIHNQPETLVYTPSGTAVVVGDTVRGGTGGATGIVKSINSSTNTLTLRSVSGFFAANEPLTVDDVSVGSVAGDSGYEIAAYVNGANASVLTDVLVSTVSESEDIGTTVRVEDIKPTGTSGQVLTSRGSDESPEFQTFQFKPSVALGNADLRPDADLSDSGGESRTYIVAKVSNVTNNSLSSNGTTSQDNFERFRTGDKVILSGDGSITADAGVQKNKVYFFRDINNTTCSLHPTLDDANNNANQIGITSITGDIVLCRYLKDCGGSVGATLFPDRDSHSAFVNNYIIVFDSSIDDPYVFSGHVNQLNVHTAAGPNENSSYVGQLTEYETTSAHCRFRASYNQNTASYTWRYMTLSVFTY